MRIFNYFSIFLFRFISSINLNTSERGTGGENLFERNLFSWISAARRLADAGVPVMIDYKLAIAHNKIILIDGTLIITGSFNFTESAEKRNAENCVFLRNSPALFAKYREYFESRRQESRMFDTKQRE